MFYYFILITAAVIIAYLLFSKARNTADYYIEKPLWFAHRGALLKEPENTISAYKHSMSLGVPAMEMDVVSTKDGVVICSHNFDLERETNGFGYIHQMKYDQLNKITVLGPTETTEPFCTLVEALQEVGENNRVNIEIKTSKILDLDTAIRVLKIIKNNDIVDRAMISSFNPFPLILVRLLNRKITTGFIIKHKELLPLIHLVKPDFIHPRGDIISSEFIEYAKRKNLRINAWTINTRPAIEWLEKRGVDGIITDRLEFYK